MIGVLSMLPYTPPLLMVNVPPAISSIEMLPSRALRPSSLMRCVWVCVGAGGGQQQRSGGRRGGSVASDKTFLGGGDKSTS